MRNAVRERNALFVGVSVGLFPLAMPGELHANQLGNLRVCQEADEGVTERVEIDAIAAFVLNRDATRDQILRQRANAGQPARKNTAGVIDALGLFQTQQIRQERHQRNSTAFLVLGRFRSQQDARLIRIEVKVGPRQLLHLATAHPGAARNEVGEQPPAIAAADKPHEFLERERTALEGLPAGRGELGNAFERVVRDQPFAVEPIEQRHCVAEVLVQGFGGKAGLIVAPADECIGGYVAAECPMTVGEKPRQPVVGMPNVIAAALPLLKVRDEIGEMLDERFLRGGAQWFRQQQSRQFFLFLPHQLLQLGFRHVFQMRVQRHIVDARPVAQAIPAAIDQAAPLLEDARPVHGSRS